jgi:hypothetical protein
MESFLSDCRPATSPSALRPVDETCRRAQVESLKSSRSSRVAQVESLGAERLPSTCSGPELVEGGRVGGLQVSVSFEI